MDCVVREQAAMVNGAVGRENQVLRGHSLACCNSSTDSTWVYSTLLQLIILGYYSWEHWKNNSWNNCSLLLIVSVSWFRLFFTLVLGVHVTHPRSARNSLPNVTSVSHIHSFTTGTDRSRAENLWLVCGVMGVVMLCDRERDIHPSKKFMLLSILKKWLALQ
jgi:hypothetical protein